MSCWVEKPPLRVVVSQRVDWIKARDEVRDALDHRLVEWLLQVGVLAAPVPNALQAQGDLAPWLAAVAPQAIVLSGGNDIGSCPVRDATEMALLDFAAEHSLPLLGICRGMQMLAHNAGGVLVAASGHAATRHPLHGIAPHSGSLPGEVNSYHDWCLSDCPTGYEVVATASDGTLEAIRHHSLPWEGWMWHPERETPFVMSDIERACSLLHGEKRI